MELTAACLFDTGSESFSLRPWKASRSFLRACSPRTAGAQAALQLVKLGRIRQSLSFDTGGSQALADSYGRTRSLRKSRCSQNLKSSARNDGSGGNLLALCWFYSGLVQSHRASSKLHSRGAVNNHSKLHSRGGVHNHGESLLDCPAALVPGFGNAVDIVGKEKWKRNSLVLTTEDLPRRASNFERTELGIASQKSLVLPEEANDGFRQLCVAVDVDEVLGSFLASLNLFIEETYSVHHDISEYYIYDFMKIWNCSQVEANLRVHAFFDSDHFKHGISPIPGAHQTLLQLASYCQLVVVTSRQHIIRDVTLEWIDRYYAGIFKEVHFGNHFAFEGPSRRKSEICRSLGANVLIDDNPRYAIDCAESGIEVLLFDLHGGYPWSKTPCGPHHPLITRVRDWKEVEQALLARTCAEL